METISTWGTMICMKCSFQKLTQFSQGNIVVHAVHTDVHGIFGEIRVLL
jgi:hypothetical protein